MLLWHVAQLADAVGLPGSGRSGRLDRPLVRGDQGHVRPYRRALSVRAGGAGQDVGLHGRVNGVDYSPSTATGNKPAKPRTRIPENSVASSKVPGNSAA